MNTSRNKLALQHENRNKHFFVGKCVDLNVNETDQGGYGCDAYTSAASCGKYDDEDFYSYKLCCNCGGGKFGIIYICDKSIISELF